VRKNFVEAAKLFQQTCNEGYEKSCFNLGVMYRDGQGVAQNRQKAIELFSQSCTMGFDLGCKNALLLKE